MNEQTTTTGAEPLAAAQETTLNEQDEWAKLADSLPNKDGHVQTTDPLFDTTGKFLPMTLTKPERCHAKDDRGVAVRVGIKFEAESIDSLGTKRAPGYIFRPRPYVIEGATASPEDQAAAERGRRDLARDMERLGVLPKLGSHSKASLIAAIGKLSDLKGKIKLWTKDGKERDEETGQVKKFQNFILSGDAPEGAAGNGTANKGPSLANV